MHRRHFLELGAAALGAAAGQQKPANEGVTATATQDKTPRVAIVLSSFRGSRDHDGTPIEGLADPQPVTASLTDAQLNAMVRKALELGNWRNGNLASLVGPEDWVLILAPEADPRMVGSVIGGLLEAKRGLRFTIAERSASGVVEDLSRRFSKVRFEIADLNAAESIAVPVSGKPLARRNADGVYTIPKLIRQCDRLITIAPLKTDPGTGVALSMKSYLGMAAGAKELGEPEEVLVDLFSLRPADYAILGGCRGIEGDRDGEVRHNVVLAGASAVAVDAVGAAVMGFDPEELAFLRHAWRRGLGIYDLDSIWTRGNEIDEARRKFRRPSRWKPARKEPAHL